jgi:hypothetical protein
MFFVHKVFRMSFPNTQTTILPSPALSLPSSTGRDLALGPNGLDQKRPKNKKTTPQAPPQTARVALGAGRSSSAHCDSRTCSLSLFLTLCRAGCGAGAQWPRPKTTQKKKKKKRREPHLRQRAWPWGRGAARAPAASPKMIFALSHIPSLTGALWRAQPALHRVQLVVPKSA